MKLNFFEKAKLYMILFFLLVLVVLIPLTIRAFSALNANSVPLVPVVPSIDNIDHGVITNIQNQWKSAKKPNYTPDDTNFLNSQKVLNILNFITNLKANSPYRIFIDKLNKIPGIMNDDNTIVSNAWWKTNPNMSDVNLQKPTLILQLQELMGYYKQIVDIIRITYQGDTMTSGMYYQLLYYSVMYINAYLQMVYLQSGTIISP